MENTAAQTVKDRLIVITVNRKNVKMQEHRPTGREIKEAAIQQGVQIQLDFQLSEKVEKKFKPIADEERVNIDNGDEFRAVAGDDNS